MKYCSPRHILSEAMQERNARTKIMMEAKRKITRPGKEIVGGFTLMVSQVFENNSWISHRLLA
jgi:hypothetical protein